VISSRHSQASFSVVRERYSLLRQRFLQIGAMNLLRWHRVTRFRQYIHSENLPARVV
jgi:hypothetical protein